MTNLRNLVIFAFYAIIRLIPPWQWPHYWRLVMADHEASVRKAVWQLKCQGRVREDQKGRLWSKK